MPKPTAPQRAVLEAARDGILFRSSDISRLYRPYRKDRVPVASVTVDRCFDHGWLAVVDAHSVRPSLVLTDAGRTALEG